jgi:hypothetical protein
MESKATIKKILLKRKHLVDGLIDFLLKITTVYIFFRYYFFIIISGTYKLVSEYTTSKGTFLQTHK